VEPVTETISERVCAAGSRSTLIVPRKTVNRRPKGPPDRRAKRTPCGNGQRGGRTAGGRGAPGVAQRPTDVRCTDA